MNLTLQERAPVVTRAVRDPAHTHPQPATEGRQVSQNALPACRAEPVEGSEGKRGRGDVVAERTEDQSRTHRCQ